MVEGCTLASRTLDEWLAYAERAHSRDIDMGLDRVAVVARRLDVLPPAQVTMIVAGTNGKGSTAVFAESVLLALGLRVGTTLSPHLRSFNERVRMNGSACDDETLCGAFAEVDAARCGVPLTYFEFAVLVAMLVFRRSAVDVGVLEVGLGGRLDACNLVDADVAVITSIGMDHEALLGHDPETIGLEKAGVLRPGQRVVLGTPMTRSVVARAESLGCRIERVGEDFHVEQSVDGWDFRCPGLSLARLPAGGLAPLNCAMGLMAGRAVVELPAERSYRPPMPDRQTVLRALRHASLPGRFQVVDAHDRHYVLDVAHNPAAARFLKDQLCRRFGGAHCGVIGWLRDKDVAGAVGALNEVVRQFVCTSVAGPRGLSATELAQRVPDMKMAGQCDDLGDALRLARSFTGAGDVILVAGSFAVVEQARSWLIGVK